MVKELKNKKVSYSEFAVLFLWWIKVNISVTKSAPFGLIFSFIPHFSAAKNWMVYEVRPGPVLNLMANLDLLCGWKTPESSFV